jgi:hypothetical protein
MVSKREKTSTFVNLTRKQARALPVILLGENHRGGLQECRHQQAGRPPYHVAALNTFGRSGVPARTGSTAFCLG